MKSQATIDIANNQKYLEALANLDPQLYLIRIALEETGVSSDIVVSLIKALANLKIGTGYGRVSVFMQGGKVINIKSEESVYILKE